MTFKPKKQQIHVPGYGVVQKEDFNDDHFKALMKRAGDKRDSFIKQHLVVESYGDQPLFADAPEPGQKPRGRGGRGKTPEVPGITPGVPGPPVELASAPSAPAETDDDAELKRLIAEEEATAGKQTDSVTE